MNKELIKHLIANSLMQQSELKMTLKYYEESGRLTDEILNDILDEIQEIEETIQKLKKGL
jgi:hypothetical protein